MPSSPSAQQQQQRHQPALNYNLRRKLFRRGTQNLKTFTTLCLCISMKIGDIIHPDFGLWIDYTFFYLRTKLLRMSGSDLA